MTIGRRLAGAVLALLGSVAAADAEPAASAPRVVSINLCTDQLVLALADPAQVLGLSPFARDPDRSWAADKADAFPIVSGSAEEVLALRPDIVLAGRYTKRATRDLLKSHGMRVEEFAPARSVAEAEAQLRRAGDLLAHRDRAEGAVSAIEAALRRVRSAADRRQLTVLPLFRRGWSSGRDTLVGSLIDSVGLRAVVAPGVPASGGFVTLEQVVALRPDRLLVTAPSASTMDQGSALLRHTALETLYPPAKRLVLPERLTACGGPMLADSLDTLAEALDAEP